MRGGSDGGRRLPMFPKTAGVESGRQSKEHRLQRRSSRPTRAAGTMAASIRPAGGWREQAMVGDGSPHLYSVAFRAGWRINGLSSRRDRPAMFHMSGRNPCKYPDGARLLGRHRSNNRVRSVLLRSNEFMSSPSTVRAAVAICERRDRRLVSPHWVQSQARPQSLPSSNLPCAAA